MTAAALVPPPERADGPAEPRAARVLPRTARPSHRATIPRTLRPGGEGGGDEDRADHQAEHGEPLRVAQGQHEREAEGEHRTGPGERAAPVPGQDQHQHSGRDQRQRGGEADVRERAATSPAKSADGDAGQQHPAARRHLRRRPRACRRRRPPASRTRPSAASGAGPPAGCVGAAGAGGGASMGRFLSGAGDGSGERGSSTRKRAPVSPGTGSTTVIRPPCRSVTQRAIASPRPVPPPESGRVPNRSKTRSRSCGVDAGSLVGDLEAEAAADDVGRHVHHPTGRAVPGGVVEQVGEQLVQAGAVGVRREVGRLDAYVEGDPALAGPRARPRLGHRRLDDCCDRLVDAVERDHAGVDAGQVEQVVDEVAEPLGLGTRDVHRSPGRAR